MKVGYGNDWTGASTRKYQIIDETISGKYILKQMPIEMINIHGEKYLAEPLTGLILRDKNEIFNIKEEE